MGRVLGGAVGIWEGAKVGAVEGRALGVRVGI